MTKLAEIAGVGRMTIHRFESRQMDPDHIRVGTMNSIKGALERAGVEFLAPDGGTPLPSARVSEIRFEDGSGVRMRHS